MATKLPVIGISRTLRVLVAVLWAVAAASCQTDKTDDTPDQDSQDGNTRMVLTLRMPSKASSTYAMDPINENDIREVDVLVFKSSGGNEIFYYQTQGRAIQNTSANGQFKKFDVTLEWAKNSSERHTLVVLANSRSYLPSSIPAGALKEDVLKTITFATAGEWNAKEGSSMTYKAFPMWGEIDGIYIDINTVPFSTLPAEVKMLRALARVDVGLDYRGGNIPYGMGNTFKLEEVYVFNSKKEAYAAPLAAAGFSLTDPTPQVYYPSIPSVANLNNTTKLSYNGANAAKTELAAQIYIAEAAAVGSADWNDATGLVVGGRYSDDPLNEGSTTTYYRVDFFDSSKNFIDILRNHRYKFNITSVSGPGHNTPEIAWSSRQENMTAEVMAWDEGNMDEVVDGFYVLRSDTKIILPYEASTRNPINVYTNYDGSPQFPTVGWTAEPMESYSWITIRNASGGYGAWDIIEFDVDRNETAINRVAKLKVTAGRMSKIVEIHQRGALGINPGEWTDGQAVDGEGRLYSLFLEKTKISVPRGVPGGSIRTYETSKVSYGFTYTFPSIHVSTDYYYGFRYLDEIDNPNNYAWYYDISRFVWVDEADKDWLSVEAERSTGSKYSLKLAISYKPYSGTALGDIREGKIYVQVGNIVRVIRVRQDVNYHVVPQNFKYTYYEESSNSSNPKIPLEKAEVVMPNAIMFTSGNQAYPKTFYEYMNVPDGYIGLDFAGNQVSPARSGSCAELNEISYLGFANWRVPTPQELQAMIRYSDMNNGRLNYYYGFYSEQMNSNYIDASGMLIHTRPELTTIKAPFLRFWDVAYGVYFQSTDINSSNAFSCRCVRTAAEFNN